MEFYGLSVRGKLEAGERWRRLLTGSHIAVSMGGENGAHGEKLILYEISLSGTLLGGEECAMKSVGGVCF